MPLVSVIVPNYQHAPYLEQRLQSIADQTFSDYEVLLLDDASKDDSPQILREWAARYAHWQFIANEQNSGSPFAQWNRGAALARGRYLWIAESDDFADPRFLARLVPLLEAHPAVAIAYSQSFLVDEKGAKMHSYRANLEFIYREKAWQEDFVMEGAEACRRWLYFHNPIPNASGILIRKEHFLAVGGADASMRLNGDWFLYAKMLCRYQLAFVAEELNYFRVHAQTQRSRSRKEASVYRELVALNQFMRQALPGSDAEADRALDEFANWWIGNLPYHRWSRANWQLNRRLYRQFAPLKKALPWRIFLTFVISYSRDALAWLGLLAPLKAWRSRLFPGKYWSAP